MNGRPRIVVIGGGIAGLTVAYRLRQHPDAGEVTLLEAGEDAGGHVGTLHEDGFTVETGPNGFLHRVREPEPMALVDELGLRDSLIEARPAARRRYILHRRKLRPVPASPVSLLTTDALSAGGKLRLVLEPFARRAPAGVEESVHAFARRRIGREAADVLVDTAVSGISAGDSHALDCAAAFPLMLEMEREHGSLVRAMFARRERPPRLVSFANGLATLTGALAARMGSALRTRARVRELERIAEIGVLSAVAQYFQNTHPFMASRFKQSPEAAENAKTRLAANLKVLDAAIGAQPFVAGERSTIADCTLFAAVEFAEFSQAPIDPACKNVARWYAAFKERPSAAA